jgi:MFS family permease
MANSGLASFAVLFLVIMYLRGPRGLSPIHASLLLVPGYVFGSVVGPYAGRLADRRGPVLPATAGLAISRGLAFAIFAGSTSLHGALAVAFTSGLHAAFYASMGFMALAAALSALRARRS